MKTITRAITFNFGVALIVRVITNLLGLVVIGLMTRHLGAEGFGQYSTVFAYLFIFSILSDMGLATFLTREISKNEGRQVETTSLIFTLRLIMVIFASIIAIAIAWQIPSYPLAVRTGIAVGTIYVIGSSLVQVMSGIFQKYFKVYVISIADVVTRVIQLGLVWFFITRGLASPVRFVIVAILAEAVHFMIVYLYARKLIAFRFQIDWTYWKSVLKSTFPIGLSLIFVLLYFKMDTVMLSIMSSAHDVGVYAVAYKVLEVVIFIPAMFVGLVMPLLSRNSSDIREFKKIFKPSFDFISALAVPAIILLFVLAEPITRLVGGPEFVESASALRILAIAVFFIFYGNLTGNAIIALDLQKMSLIVYSLGALMNITANYFLIPHYSYIAASWTTLGTEVFVTLGMFWVIYQKTGQLHSWKRFGPICASALAMTALVYPTRHNFILALFLSLTYFIFLYLFRAFTRAELRSITSIKSFSQTTSTPE